MVQTVQLDGLEAWAAHFLDDELWVFFRSPAHKCRAWGRVHRHTAVHLLACIDPNGCTPVATEAFCACLRPQRSTWKAMSNAPLVRLSAAESAACVRGSDTCAQRCSLVSQKSSTTPRVVLTCREGWTEQDAALRGQTARARGLETESFPHCPLRGLRPPSNCGCPAVAFHRKSSTSLSCRRDRSPWFACSENHKDSAVAVCFLVVDALFCRSCFLCPLLFSTATHGSDSAEFVEVPLRSSFLVVDVAVFMQRQVVSRQSSPLSQFIARVSGYFSRSRDGYAQFQLCMPGLAAMRGSLLQFCSIFRPPSFWTLRPRVAGTPGV